MVPPKPKGRQIRHPKKDAELAYRPELKSTWPPYCHRHSLFHGHDSGGTFCTVLFRSFNPVPQRRICLWHLVHLLSECYIPLDTVVPTTASLRRDIEFTQQVVSDQYVSQVISHVIISCHVAPSRMKSVNLVDFLGLRELFRS